MRVLFVNLNKSAVFGGLERWMVDMGVGLEARGHRCVVVGRPEAPWLGFAEAHGLRTRGDHAGPWLQRAWRITAAMRAERPDVVVVKAKKAARMATWGRALSGVGKVVMLFGLTHELRPARWVDRHTWRQVDAGIVLAHAQRRWYVEHGFGPASKLHVLWKGVDTERFRPRPEARAARRAALGLADGELAVGTVGRLAWQKGIDNLFAAVERVRPRVPAARFFVLGDGREAEAIRAAAAGLGGAVTLLGHDEDVPGFLAGMDVAVLPSRQEAMSQTTLEAMAAGLPVISTDTVGAAEAIEDGRSGRIVPTEDPDALADAIVSLAADPDGRSALGAAARARAEAEFTLVHGVDRVERALVALTGAAGSADDRAA